MSELSEDSLFTAARRVVRNARSDNEAHGGLLSRETMQAVEIMARWVDREERRIKKELEPKVDVVWQGIRWMCPMTEALDSALSRGAIVGDSLLVLQPGAKEVEQYTIAARA